MATCTTRKHSSAWANGTFSDDEIGALLNQRDARALEGLLQRAPRLEAILWRQFGTHIPSEDLQDIVADTLLDAMRKGDRYNAELASLMRWLTVLGHYNALEFLRKNKIFSGAGLDKLGHHEAAHVKAQARIVTEVPSKVMERYIDQLPPRQAEIIRWYFYEGLSVEQIAERLSIKLVTVRSYKTRGLQGLRDLMSDTSEV